MSTQRKTTDRVIFHHSLSHDVSAKEIDLWHVKRGFSCIGYHFVIRQDGSIERGRHIEDEGAHAKGKNHDSIGVCITGDFSKHEPTIQQYGAAKRLFKAIALIYGDVKLEFHHETCPGKLFNRDMLEILCTEERGVEWKLR